ncbi:serine protease [Stagnihabitans tardus]|uniref:Peptidoglycan-binding protein n=1 Tax=Stagnihabitans tardus TaxID=2699202 RepID=A0AAE4YEZ3_9RHOB|nr:serine protease [Stagnihabitans tardus]NBZ88934.1 peptidoglycan-binding protein [Stagnihabitans tardus]
MRIFSFTRVMALLAAVFMGGGAAQAQDQVWLQVEAQPNLAKAQERAGAYAAALPEVQGYQLDSGWYGIAIGPMGSDRAVELLQSLTASGAIPPDSYITDGASFGPAFWPAEGQDPAAALPEQSAEPAVEAPVAADQSAEPTLPDETPAEAKASEAALTDAQRQELQMALKWFGFYEGKVDGRIGSGSRKSMAAWQEAQGLEPTGILTTAQRGQLVEGYKSEEGLFGFAMVTEPEAGIELTLPMAMLEFDGYSPPFVRYKGKDGAQVSAMLISEPGTKATLAGLYDILQSLDTMPTEGERALGEDSFTITGRNDRIESLAYAMIAGGNVKGFVLTWDAALSAQMQRVLPLVQSSFRSTGEKSMDPGLVPLDEAVKRGLIAGIAAKQPKASATGFFVDPKGAAVTLASAVASCGKVTLDHRTEVTVKALGDLALLTPKTPVAPRAFASFAPAAPVPGTPVTLAGYSWGERLSAPVLTRGTLEEAQGLNGEQGVARLNIGAMAGDLGGPVLDASGAVLGMLIPAPAGKELPGDVGFVATSATLSQVLADPAGGALILTPATATGKATPDALNAAARGMTVLVSCWE